MLKLPNPRNYTLSEALLIFRNISRYLNAKPFALQTEGVFRISGRQSHSQEIIEYILKNERFESAQYLIHDYIGALKLVLSQTLLMNEHNDDNEDIHHLKESLSAASIEECSSSLNNFIYAWARSGDAQKFCIAELLYTYLHIASNALFFCSKNRMSAENIGIVVGPTIANLLEADPLRVLAFIHRFNKISENILQEGHYTESFDSKFQSEASKMRAQLRESLEEERALILKIRDIYAEKLCQYQSEIAQLESALENNTGLTRKERKHKKQEIEYNLSQKRMAIRILKKDDKANQLKRLFNIELQIEEIKRAESDTMPSKLLVFSLRRTNSFVATLPDTENQSLLQLAQKRKSLLK